MCVFHLDTYGLGTASKICMFTLLTLMLSPIWTRRLFEMKKPWEKVIGNYGMTFRVGVTDNLSARLRMSLPLPVCVTTSGFDMARRIKLWSQTIVPVSPWAKAKSKVTLTWALFRSFYHSTHSLPKLSFLWFSCWVWHVLFLSPNPLIAHTSTRLSVPVVLDNDLFSTSCGAVILQKKNHEQKNVETW